MPIIRDAGRERFALKNALTPGSLELLPVISTTSQLELSMTSLKMPKILRIFWNFDLLSVLMNSLKSQAKSTDSTALRTEYLSSSSSMRSGRSAYSRIFLSGSCPPLSPRMSRRVFPSIAASVSGSDGLYFSKSERILSATGTNT